MVPGIIPVYGNLYVLGKMDMKLKCKRKKVCIMTDFDTRKSGYDRNIYKKIHCDMVKPQIKRKEERE